MTGVVLQTGMGCFQVLTTAFGGQAQQWNQRLERNACDIVQQQGQPHIDGQAVQRVQKGRPHLLCGTRWTCVWGGEVGAHARQTDQRPAL